MNCQSICHPLVIHKFQKRVEQEQIYTYLAGLNPSFEPVRAKILLAPELSSSSIMAMVQREESRRKSMNCEPSTENQAFLANH